MWILLWSRARKKKSQKMDGQWVEFQKRSKIQEENASVWEQINQPGTSLSGITRGLEGQATQWLCISHKQSSKPGPHTRHMWWTWHSTKCSSAQAKIVSAATESTEEGLEERGVGAEESPITLEILTSYNWYCSRRSEFRPYISGTDFFFPNRHFRDAKLKS